MAYSYDDKLDFIADLYCPARVIADQSGCSWKLILGQAAGETGWGEKCLPGTNNVFNIKADASWSGPSKVFHVSETVNHHIKWVDDPFRVYPSVKDSLLDRVDFLKRNPRYHALSADGVKGNYKEEAQALQDAGYATDPEYASKLIKIIEGPSMRRAIARATARGCAADLPAMGVLLRDGAMVPIAGAAVQVLQDGKQADTATDDKGRLVVRTTPKGGAINLKVFDKHANKWVDLDPIAPAQQATGRDVTLTAPTFSAQTSTREHEKKPATPAPAPSVPKAPPTPAASAAKATPAGHYTTYTVVKGDTLSTIAAQFGVRYQTIAQANGISSPYIIRAEQRLRIPDVKAALAAQEKRHAAAANDTSARPPAVPAVPAVPARALGDGKPQLHTVYLRNKAAHPQTDLMHASRAPWMAPAQEEFDKGVRRRPGSARNDPHILAYFTATPTLDKHMAALDETPYCAAFANWCLGHAGFKGTGNAMALSFKNWGRPTRDNRPALGAVAVIKFASGSAHVTFVAGISSDGKQIATLGGNQGKTHEVSHNYCPKHLVIAYRYPADYPDYDDDYVLHDVASDHASMSAASTH